MTARIATFNFNSLTVRTVDIDGILWFPAVDVADAIGADRSSIGKHMRMVLDAEETRLLLKGETAGEIRPLFAARSPRMVMVSESGLYKFILRTQPSNAAAKSFQDWVTRTVLPALRKDGGYVVGEEKFATGEMTEDELILKAMTVMQGKIERLKAENMILTHEWANVTIAEYVASSHVYLSQPNRNRLASKASRLAKERGIEIQKSQRTYESPTGPIDTAVNVYPRDLLDEANEALGLFEVRKLALS